MAAAESAELLECNSKSVVKLYRNRIMHADACFFINGVKSWMRHYLIVWDLSATNVFIVLVIIYALSTWCNIIDILTGIIESIMFTGRKQPA